MATIMVTNMPFWADRVGVPRALGVEMPFGHILGKPGDSIGQRRIIEQALDVLESAGAPGMVVHSEFKWAGTAEEAARLSHPAAPPPIMGEMGKHIANLLRSLRRVEA